MIGIFDSGLGGLTITKSIINKLPYYDYIYLADNARTPYGNKSQENIYQYTKEAIDFLFARGCKIIIIACNTASSKALRKIQQEYLPIKYPGKRVLGVIRPLVEQAVNNSYKRIGVIGTEATINSNAYVIELHNLKPDLLIVQQAAPLLVPLIEEGWLQKPETKMILKKYLIRLKRSQVQALIPACTHYPFLLPELQRIMTKKCTVLNPGQIIAQSFADYLKRHPEIQLTKSDKYKLHFFTTDDPDKFKNIGSKYLSQPITNVQRIIL